MQERDYIAEQIEKRPDAMWKTNTMWTFRNDAKVYGSPWFDATWAATVGGPDPMPAVLRHFRGNKGRKKGMETDEDE